MELTFFTCGGDEGLGVEVFSSLKTFFSSEDFKASTRSASVCASSAEVAVDSMSFLGGSAKSSFSSDLFFVYGYMCSFSESFAGLNKDALILTC